MNEAFRSHVKAIADIVREEAASLLSTLASPNNRYLAIQYTLAGANPTAHIVEDSGLLAHGIVHLFFTLGFESVGQTFATSIAALLLDQPANIWLEDCVEERKALLRKLSNLQYARTKIISLLDPKPTQPELEAKLTQAWPQPLPMSTRRYAHTLLAKELAASSLPVPAEVQRYLDGLLAQEAYMTSPPMARQYLQHLLNRREPLPKLLQQYLKELLKPVTKSV